MRTELQPEAAPEAATPVPSPCVSLCQMDAGSGLCQGCLRTLAEIVQWSGASDDLKRTIWAEIRRREQSLPFD
jgi:predicted Fe-S protein YdhL (DUF1289 family)